MLRVLWRPLLAVFALACAAPKPLPNTAAAPAAEPAPKSQLSQQEIEARLSAELPPMPSFEIAAPDGSLKAKIEASAAPKVSAEEGFWMVEAPFGSGVLSCFFYPEGKDAGEVMRVMADVTLGKNAPDHRWVDLRGDQVEGWGYVLGRAHYYVMSGGQKMIGDFKLATSVRGETTVSCMLDVPGLSASFERSLRTLLGSIALAKPASYSEASEQSITRARIENKLVVLTRSATFVEAKQTVEQSFTTHLQIGQDGKLVTSDSASTTTYQKGKLAEAKYATSSEGELDHDITLTLAPATDTYTVAGKLQEKPISGTFSVKGGLPDSERGRLAACQVRDGKVQSVELPEYSAEADPLHPSVSVLEKSTTPEADVVITLEGTPMRILAKLDGVCDLERGTMQIGAVSTELERLWHVKAPSR